MKICSIEGCENKSRVMGWCAKHYVRWKKYGDPTIILRAERGARFQYIKDHMFDGCCSSWPYGKETNGYIEVSVAGKRSKAHRFVCEQIHGPAPEGKPHALHKCGKGHLGCFNADCLYWGNEKGNRQDAINHGTQVWPKGEKSKSAKLTDLEVDEIRAEYCRNEVTQKQLANKYGVDRSYICRIINLEKRVSSSQ